MAKTITVELSNTSIDKAIKELKEYKKWVLLKEKELRTRLAQIGVDIATIKFSGATYDGTNDVSVRWADNGSKVVIYAEGKSVAFIEFGAGVRYGYGHPLASQLGMGPGTYPSEKGLWDRPKGWWYGHSEHSYGNPPAMAMYSATKEITENITRIAQEVFA